MAGPGASDARRNNSRGDLPMFKKTILVAALGAISAGAYAADVELYGVVDTGL